MKFGKLSNIEDVDFDFPGTPPETRALLEQQKHSEGPLNIYIGATGWGMKEWVGTVYPSGTKTKDYLYHYSRQFNTIELNTTHYRIPNLSTIEKWKNSVPRDFKFCPKIPQSISHSKTLGLNTGQIDAFCHAIAGLEENLGSCFMQLPPYFDSSRLPLLQQFLSHFPREIALAIELRHESWFLQDEAFLTFLRILGEYHQHTVITDVAGRRDVLHMQLSSNQAMVRFVGNGLHPSDYKRIEDWVDRLKEWKDLGLKTVYFFPHEPDNILAPELAAFLFQKIQTNIDLATVRGPNLDPATKPGRQMNLFE